MAVLTRSGELEEIVMLAEDSMRASATPYPIPFHLCQLYVLGLNVGRVRDYPMFRQ